MDLFCGPEKTVLSASRRTDIPAFYMDWFVSSLDQGEFTVPNPFSGKESVVPATPDRVHSIVFWSKNYGPFLKAGHAAALRKRGYGLAFQFTVNTHDTLLEPGVPPLSVRLAQLDGLARAVSPEAVTWRFDPICHYTRDRAPGDNLGDFLRIADAAAKAGIIRCATSFLDLYKKTLRRAGRVAGFAFYDPPPERKRELLGWMEKELKDRGISLSLCCEGGLLQSLPQGSAIAPASCVSHALLERLYGPGLSHQADKGQRAAEGCGCKTSRDIGSYRGQPCRHGCLYCYANPGR
jgi:hypothetical protein